MPVAPSSRKVLSAVAWPYANGPRHIGHVAGFGVPSDVFSRYMRMAGHDVLMVSGTDEHGTPILIAADEAGVSAQELADTNHRLIAEDLCALGVSYDLYTRTTTAQPHRRGAGAVPRASTPTATSWNGRRTARSRRPPDAPCPTATSRAPARSAGPPGARGDQCDTCGNQLDAHDLIDPRVEDQRRDAGVRRDPALLPRPAGAGRRAQGVARRARGQRHLAAQRHPVQPEHPRGHQPARDDPRHRLGHPGPARRLARQPHQAALRLVRRGHRLPVGVGRVGPPHRRPGALARVVERPRGAVLLLHGQGQHHLPLPDLAGRAAGLLRQGLARAASPAHLRRAQPADRGGLERVPHHGGHASSPPPSAWSSTSATCWRATSPTRSATSSPPPARRTRTPTSPGPSSSGAPTTSWSRAGATWSTAPPP